VIEVSMGEDHGRGTVVREGREVGEGSVTDAARTHASVDEQVAFLEDIQIGAGSNFVGAAEADEVEVTQVATSTVIGRVSEAQVGVVVRTGAARRWARARQ